MHLLWKTQDNENGDGRTRKTTGYNQPFKQKNRGMKVVGRSGGLSALGGPSGVCV